MRRATTSDSYLPAASSKIDLKDISLKRGAHKLTFQIIMYCVADSCNAENDQVIIEVSSDKSKYHKEIYNYNNVDRKFIGWQEKSFDFSTDKDDVVTVKPAYI